MSSNLDPANSQAFVTGLTFEGGGQVSLTQSPISTAVPEPAASALMLTGFGLVGMASRRRPAGRMATGVS